MYYLHGDDPTGNGCPIACAWIEPHVFNSACLQQPHVHHLTWTEVQVQVQVRHHASHAACIIRWELQARAPSRNPLVPSSEPFEMQVLVEIATFIPVPELWAEMLSL